MKTFLSSSSSNANAALPPYVAEVWRTLDLTAWRERSEGKIVFPPSPRAMMW
jgi:hypothetical protein